MADKTFDELEAEAKAEATKKDAPKKDAPKKDAPKKDAPKKDAPKKDAPKKDAPKAYKKNEALPFDEIKRRMQLQKAGAVVVSGKASKS